jgi:hypothetical protein
MQVRSSLNLLFPEKTTQTEEALMNLPHVYEWQHAPWQNTPIPRPRPFRRRQRLTFGTHARKDDNGHEFYLPKPVDIFTRTHARTIRKRHCKPPVS